MMTNRCYAVIVCRVAFMPPLTDATRAMLGSLKAALQQPATRAA